jgi:uncharacterized membrane protein
MTTSVPDQSAATHRAKRPRSIVAGPYGHPFHPVMVTVPIGAWVSAVVFDLIAAFGGDATAFTRGATWLVAIGVVGALVAAVFGLLDLSVVPRGTRAFRVGITHMVLNLSAVALFVVSFFVHRSHGYDDVSAAGLVLALVGVAALGASGWLGGMLAYHYGVRVADEATQAEGFR